MHLQIIKLVVWSLAGDHLRGIITLDDVKVPLKIPMGSSKCETVCNHSVINGLDNVGIMEVLPLGSKAFSKCMVNIRLVLSFILKNK